MKKSLLFFIVNLAFILADAHFQDETSVDGIDDSTERVDIAIEDGVSNPTRQVATQ